MALPIFAITLFVSAFLLFLVQPMIGKLILPKLGGTPQVWNTCMVFFQSVLLLGYAYTHWVSTRLKLRKQLMLHCGLLAVPIVMMLIFPFYQTVKAWIPPSGGNPIPQALLLLATVVGVPFFVVSTSAPLLQKWFAYSGDPAAKDPYFLYGASNLGSLLSLIFYPFLMEPYTMLATQSTVWLVGYVVLVAMVAFCAYKIFYLAPPDSVLEAEALASVPSLAPKTEAPAPEPAPAPVPAPAVETATAVKAGPGPGGGRMHRKKGMKVAAPGKQEDDRPIAKPHAPVISGAEREMSMWRRVRWVLLAAVPSSLMLGVTSYVSTDLSPFPLVWAVPLGLYLLSFILVYMKVWTGKPLGTGGYTPHDITIWVLQPIGIFALCFIVLSGGFSPFFPTLVVMVGFFFNALACHGELAQDRPATKYLTEYFLLMSVGGMIGGLFNGIIAPVVFQRGVYEFHIAIVMACMVRPQYVPSGWFDELVLNAFPGLQGWVRTQGDEMAKSMGRPAPHSTYLFSVTLDIVFGLFILSISWWLATTFNTPGNLAKVIAFLQASREYAAFIRNAFVLGIPLVFCFFFAGRPLRISLAVTGLLLGNLYLADRDDRSLLEARRTYFGVLRVMMDVEGVRDVQENSYFRDPLSQLKNEDGIQVSPPYAYTFLMHGTTYHGRNYLRHDGDKYDKDRIDLTRLATTYYHRYGPVGVVLEQYNWFKGRQNTFYADMRMPASLVGQMASSLGVGQLPMGALVDTWSEPPLATIGLGTGTMASYSRPYGSFTYYEIDDVIRGFSLPEDGGEARFTFLQNAIRRGVNLEVIMGDARQSLEPLREKTNIENSFVFAGDFKDQKGKDYFYSNAPYNWDPDKRMKSFAPDRNNYYKAINVDAFSSDAIPVHLVTKEAIMIYLSKLTMDGVLCVHTSNRHMDLVRPVARIALALSDEAEKDGGPKVQCIVGKDLGERERYMGHFTSEYVMLFRGKEFPDYIDMLAKKKKEFIKNRAEAVKKGEAALLGSKELMMQPEGNAPDGWQILNSQVEWYDPYTDHETIRGGRRVKDPITRKDAVWTDDYTSILPLLR